MLSVFMLIIFALAGVVVFCFIKPFVNWLKNRNIAETRKKAEAYKNYKAKNLYGQ